MQPNAQSSLKNGRNTVTRGNNSAQMHAKHLD